MDTESEWFGSVGVTVEEKRGLWGARFVEDDRPAAAALVESRYRPSEYCILNIDSKPRLETSDGLCLLKIFVF